MFVVSVSSFISRLEALLRRRGWRRAPLEDATMLQDSSVSILKYALMVSEGCVGGDGSNRNRRHPIDARLLVRFNESAIDDGGGKEAQSLLS